MCNYALMQFIRVLGHITNNVIYVAEPQNQLLHGGGVHTKPHNKALHTPIKWQSSILSISAYVSRNDCVNNSLMCRWLVLSMTSSLVGMAEKCMPSISSLGCRSRSRQAIREFQIPAHLWPWGCRVQMTPRKVNHEARTERFESWLLYTHAPV